MNAIPEYTGHLRSNIIKVPKVVKECSGIIVLGKHIKSLLFTTDVAIIRNHNADAIIAVYPFTPQPAITHSLLIAADVPIFCGVGGGMTGGMRSIELAANAEYQGAIGVVLNKPATNELIRQLKERIEIPVVVTVVDDNEDIEGRLAAGVDFFNVSGAAKTAEIVKHIRMLSPTVPIIATGGRNEDDIRATIEAGANAISITPPTTGELFKKIMERLRSKDV